MPVVLFPAAVGIVKVRQRLKAWVNLKLEAGRFPHVISRLDQQNDILAQAATP